MRAKYLFQWFPPIIEHPLKEVKMKQLMDEYEQDMLKDELGHMLFGEQFNQYGLGNAELPSRMAGELGAEVKRWKDVILDDIVLKHDKD